MKRRIGFAGIAVLIVAGGLTTTLQRDASALTKFDKMKKAMQNVSSAHLSSWENTMSPDRQFYRRELWVQGNQLRQHIPGKLWLISTPDTNWYYIAEEDRLEQQAHKQLPVTFDISQTLGDVQGIRGDGKGVLIESGPDTVLRGRQVAQIRVTQLAPSSEQIAGEQARAAAFVRDQKEKAQLKGDSVPNEEAKQVTAPSLHSRRSLYWVDKVTNLLLHSEDYVENNGKLILVQRGDYTYNEPISANLFDPQDLVRVGRQERRQKEHRR